MAEAEFNVAPSKRIRLDDKFNKENCIFCSENFTKRNHRSSTDVQTLHLLFDACVATDDELGLEVLVRKKISFLVM